MGPTRVVVLFLSAAVLAGCKLVDLSAKSLPMSARPTPSPSPTATPSALTAFAFIRDPGSDTNDPTIAFSSVANLTGASVTLPDQAPGILSDRSVKVSQDSEFPHQIVQVTTGTASLPYQPKDVEFAEVNAYYHADQLVRRLKSLSVFPSSYQVTDLDPHCDGSVDPLPDGINHCDRNAYFDPPTRVVRLGFADVSAAGRTTRVRAAHDADVIFHEFGHSFNHTYVADEEIWVNIDSGAIDEGTADFWSFAMNRYDPGISFYFARALREASGSVQTGAPKPLRDISVMGQYPSQVVDERHADSQFWSPILYQLSKDPALANDPGKEMKLVSRVLSDLQRPASLAQAINALRAEATAFGVNFTPIDTFLSAHGLLRSDDVSVLSLAPIDIVIFDKTGNGNCNGVLDVGETVAVLLDLKNNGSTVLGNVIATLTTTAPASAIQFAQDGDIASYAYFLAGKKYSQTPLMTNAYGTAKDTLSYAVYVVHALATGTYDFTVHLQGMDTIDAHPSTLDIPFSIKVWNTTGYTCGG